MGSIMKLTELRMSHRALFIACTFMSEYKDTQKLMSEYGIDLPDIKDSRKSYTSVYENILNLQKQIKTAEDDKEKQKLKKFLAGAEAQFAQLYHQKIADTYQNLLFEEGIDDTYWIYNDTTGTYDTLNFSTVRGIVMRAYIQDGFTPTTAWARECLSRYRAEYPERGHAFDEFDAPCDMLHVENGWLNLTTFELTPHTPEMLSTIKAPTVYDPKAKAPTYHKLFEQWEMTQDQIDCIHEFSGNAITADSRAGRLLILEGIPGTGKSLLANIWTHMLGDLAVREQSLDSFVNNPRFCKYSFIGKRMIWFNETNTKRTQMGVELQKMIDGRTFTVERKGVSKETEHPNLASCLLTTNQLPDSMGDGMESRLMYIKYTKRFRGTENDDTDLDTKVLEERSGVLNAMIEGLKRYRKNKKYTKIEKQDEIMDEYRLTSSPAIEFFETHFDPIQDIAGETFVYTKDMFTAFNAYVRGKVGYYTTPEKFAREVLSHLPRRFDGKVTSTRKNDGRGICGLTPKFGLRWGVGEDAGILLSNQNDYDTTNSEHTPDEW